MGAIGLGRCGSGEREAEARRVRLVVDGDVNRRLPAIGPAQIADADAERLAAFVGAVVGDGDLGFGARLVRGDGDAGDGGVVARCSAVVDIDQRHHHSVGLGRVDAGGQRQVGAFGHRRRGGGERHHRAGVLGDRDVDFQGLAVVVRIGRTRNDVNRNELHSLMPLDALDIHLHPASRHPVGGGKDPGAGKDFDVFPVLRRHREGHIRCRPTGEKYEDLVGSPVFAHRVRGGVEGKRMAKIGDVRLQCRSRYLVIGGVLGGRDFMADRDRLVVHIFIRLGGDGHLLRPVPGGVAIRREGERARRQGQLVFLAGAQLDGHRGAGIGGELHVVGRALEALLEVDGGRGQHHRRVAVVDDVDEIPVEPGARFDATVEDGAEGGLGQPAQCHP